MSDFSISLPAEVCATLGQRARARRLALNLPAEELAARVGVSEKTLRNFEQTGRCNLETFVRVLEALNAQADLQGVLLNQSRTIEHMRQQALQAKPRQRASAPRPRKPPVESAT